MHCIISCLLFCNTLTDSSGKSTYVRIIKLNENNDTLSGYSIDCLKILQFHFIYSVCLSVVYCCT